MEDWEMHFRKKSGRRARARAIEDRVKIAGLSLFIAGLAGAGWLVMFGAR